MQSLCAERQTLTYARVKPQAAGLDFVIIYIYKFILHTHMYIHKYIGRAIIPINIFKIYNNYMLIYVMLLQIFKINYGYEFCFNNDIYFQAIEFSIIYPENYNFDRFFKIHVKSIIDHINYY